jgi:hypothetical protein
VSPDELSDLRRRVLRLEETEVARGLLHAYAHALDVPVAERVASLFAVDGTLRTSRGVAEGRAEISEFFRTAFAADPSVKRHFIMTPRATWLGPGRVRLQSYFLYVGRGADASVIGWGTYDDIIDVSGPEPLFAEKVIEVHVGTDLATGWAT